MQILFSIILILILFFLWVILYDSNRFVVRHYEFESSKVNDDIKILFLSDLHLKQYGKNNEKLINEIDNLKPDVILIGGDMITAKYGKKIEVFKTLINSLSDYKLLFAEGNHEYRLKLYPEKYNGLDKEYEAFVNEKSLDILINDKRSVEINESIIDVFGLSIDKEYYKRFKTPIPAKGYVASKLPHKGESFTILLAHNPKWLDAYTEFAPDLILSGHYHGGIMRLPFNRGLISPDLRPFTKFSYGMYGTNKSPMILSAGLGVHTIPVRLFNPAELTYIEIKKEK